MCTTNLHMYTQWQEIFEKSIEKTQSQKYELIAVE